MTKGEFDELVEEVSDRLGIGKLVDGAYIDQLFEETNGHPVYYEGASRRSRINGTATVTTPSGCSQGRNARCPF